MSVTRPPTGQQTKTGEYRRVVGITLPARLWRDLAVTAVDKGNSLGAEVSQHIQATFCTKLSSCICKDCL